MIALAYLASVLMAWAMIGRYLFSTYRSLDGMGALCLGFQCAIVWPLTLVGLIVYHFIIIDERG